MRIGKREKAMILLTIYLPWPGQIQKEDPKPLGHSEWARLHAFLLKRDLKPETLLSIKLQVLFEEFTDKTITLNRIQKLLKQADRLTYYFNVWEKNKIWLITEENPYYPENLKALKGKKPPLLFGIGDKRLLKKRYFGIVGARNISSHERNNAYNLGKKGEALGIGVVSGDAAGCDAAGMLGALEAGGYSMAFVADNIVKKANSNVYKQYISQGKLLLVTHQNPTGTFSKMNLHIRNQFIYALPKTTVIICANQTGGTWKGATQALKTQEERCLFVMKSSAKNRTKAHEKLLVKGAYEMTNIEDLEKILKVKKAKKQQTLF